MSLPSCWIGFAGLIASGKTTAARYLADQHEFTYVRYSQVLAEMLGDRDREVTRASLQQIGQEVFEAMGGRGLTELLVQRVGSSPRVVVDGLRHADDFLALTELATAPFQLVFLDATLPTRRARYLEMAHHETPFEVAVSHPVECEIGSLREYSTYQVDNDGSLGQLMACLDRVVEDSECQ